MQAAYKTDDAVFESVKRLVCERLKELSPDLTYHNLDHTLDVTCQSERIAREEGVTDEKLLHLLKVAALYHDTGFLRTYANHEIVSCAIFLEDADRFGFSEEDRELIKGLIMATRLPQMPATHLQKVICDADLDYLGRADFLKIGSALRDEFLTHGVIKSEEEWNALQLRFLTHHQYHTVTSRESREALKKENIARLI